MVRRKYENPPIKEVVCEFRFTQTAPWDPTFPGLIFEKLREDFPFRDKGKDIQTEIIVENDQIHPKVNLFERAIFRNNEGNIIIQIGANHLAINHLAPYTSWDNFLSIIDKALSSYIEVTESVEFDRIELKHINEFLFEPGLTYELEDYFDFYPHFGHTLENGYNSFIVGIQTDYEEDIQKIQMTNNQFSIILETNYFTGKPNTISYDEVIQWLENAHTKNNEAFEGSIKQKLRSTFREVNGE